MVVPPEILKEKQTYNHQHMNKTTFGEVEPSLMKVGEGFRTQTLDSSPGEREQQSQGSAYVPTPFHCARMLNSGNESEPAPREKQKFRLRFHFQQKINNK